MRPVGVLVAVGLIGLGLASFAGPAGAQSVDPPPVDPDRMMAPTNVGATARDQSLHPDYLLRIQPYAANAAMFQAGLPYDQDQLDLFLTDPYRHDWASTRGRIREVAFENRYGATLRGHLFAPLGTGPFPPVVFIGGYPGSGGPAYWSNIERLVEEGYVVLSFDPQGVGASDVDPAPEYCGGDGDEWWRQPQEAGLIEERECAGWIEDPLAGDPTGGYLALVPTLLSEEEFRAFLAEGYASFRPSYVFGAVDAGHWLVSSENPWRSLVDAGAGVGVFGHSAGADASTLAAASDDLFAAAVSMDSYGPTTEHAPSGAPTLFLGGHHMSIQPGYDTQPGVPPTTEAAAAWRDAGVETGLVMVDDAIHGDFAYAPWPISAQYSNLPLTRSIAHYYTLAWFDHFLKGDDTARTRLEAEVFDGSADRTAIDQGTFDVVTQTNVPYLIEGRQVASVAGRRADAFMALGTEPVVEAPSGPSSGGVVAPGELPATGAGHPAIAAILVMSTLLAWGRRTGRRRP